MTNLLHLAVVVLHPFNLTPRYTVTTAPQALSDSVPLRSHMCVSLKSPFYCNPGSRYRYAVCHCCGDPGSRGWVKMKLLLQGGGPYVGNVCRCLAFTHDELAGADTRG